MKLKQNISYEAERERETYRCPFCGRFIDHDTDGYFDREDRSDECSDVLIFCSEDHANRYHHQRRLP